MFNLIFLSLFYLSLASVLFYFVQRDIKFNAIIYLFVSLIIVYCFLSVVKISIPIALLIGPLLLYLQYSLEEKDISYRFHWHFLPFLVAGIAYNVGYYSVTLILSNFLAIYFPFYYLFSFISMLGYGLFIAMKKGARDHYSSRQQLVLQLSTINLGAAVFFGVRSLSLFNILPQNILGIEPQYLIYGMLLFSSVYMIAYLKSHRKEHSEVELDMEEEKSGVSKYTSFTLPNETLREYALLLERTMEEKKLYLNSGLSLSDLSQETGIPKHHFSQLFNVHFQKTFYQYIAELRIEEAIYRIEKDANVTLESLAYDCGFNSKTSFNRYFKDIMGKTPSEYRSKYELDKSIY